MPSVSSASADEPVSMAFGLAALAARASVIALPLLPFPALQAEPRHQDGREQEGNHRRRYRGALAQLAAQNGALIGQRRHQMRGIDRATARHHPDELEVCEGE